MLCLIYSSALIVGRTMKVACAPLLLSFFLVCYLIFTSFVVVFWILQGTSGKRVTVYKSCWDDARLGSCHMWVFCILFCIYFVFYFVLHLFCFVFILFCIYFILCFILFCILFYFILYFCGCMSSVGAEISL